MKRKTAKIVYYALAVIGFLFIAAGCVGYGRVWLYIGIGFMALCTWVGMQFNRCPHCGFRLGIWRKLNTCPSCGEDISDC